jgi:hypothetical protein
VQLLHSVNNITVAATWVGCLRRQIRSVGCGLATAANAVSTVGMCWCGLTSWSRRGPARPQGFLVSRDIEVCDKVLSHILEIATGSERLYVVVCSSFALQI